jgi:hypothetical protein
MGASVAQMVVRAGTPPLDIIPGFQAKFLAAGIIGWASTSLQGIEIAKVNATTARSGER